MTEGIREGCWEAEVGREYTCSAAPLPPPAPICLADPHCQALRRATELHTPTPHHPRAQPPHLPVPARRREEKHPRSDSTLRSGLGICM